MNIEMNYLYKHFFFNDKDKDNGIFGIRNVNDSSGKYCLRVYDTKVIGVDLIG